MSGNTESTNSTPLQNNPHYVTKDDLEALRQEIRELREANAPSVSAMPRQSGNYSNNQNGTRNGTGGNSPRGGNT